MTKKELSQALEIVHSKERFIDSNGKHLVDISIFDGYGYSDFEPVYCTLKQVAFLIRWQCVRMNGTMDADEFNNLAKIGRKKFQIVGH